MPGKPGELGGGFFTVEARYVSNFRDDASSKSVPDPAYSGVNRSPIPVEFDH